VNTRITLFAAAMVLTGGVLAGCGAPPADIDSGTAAEMQTTVVSIAESAAAGDAAGALTQLDGLQQQLDAAHADGSVSAERAAAIQTRIDLVRADLQPEPAPVVEPSTDPAPDPTVSDQDGGDEGGSDNSGPGNNNGNGNGNNNGNGNDEGDGKGNGKDD